MTISEIAYESRSADHIDRPSEPQVSVVLPVYNGAPFLRMAIESVLAQEFSDFEFIIVDDGSTDDSWRIINSYHDRRIVQISQQNIGLAATLNRAISLCRGPLIARQDQDDISKPTRLALQVRFLNDHPEVALCGTWALLVDEHGRKTGQMLRPRSNSSLLALEMLFENPIAHASVLAKKSVLIELGGYPTDPEIQPPEDYALWSRMMQRRYLFYVIEEPLLLYRQNPSGMSRSASREWKKRVAARARENRLWFLDVTGFSSSKVYRRILMSSESPGQALRVDLSELILLGFAWRVYAKSKRERLVVMLQGFAILVRTLLKVLLQQFGLFAITKRLASLPASLRKS